MNIAQQIVGVNERLGNYAVPNMQGTTRSIYDSVALAALGSQTVTLFAGISSKTYPFANITNNRFEVGESLAISSISYAFGPPDADFDSIADDLFESNVTSATASTTYLLNLYIGNQRVIKDFDLNYGRFGVGEAYKTSRAKNVVQLETPIVIPPQIEFYATVQLSQVGNSLTRRFYLFLNGQGTLLNTKETF